MVKVAGIQATLAGQESGFDTLGPKVTNDDPDMIGSVATMIRFNNDYRALGFHVVGQVSGADLGLSLTLVQDVAANEQPIHLQLLMRGWVPKPCKNQ